MPESNRSAIWPAASRRASFDSSSARLTMTVAYVIQSLRCHQTSGISRPLVEGRDEIDQSPPPMEGPEIRKTSRRNGQELAPPGSFGDIARQAPELEITALSRPQSGVGSSGPVHAGSGSRRDAGYMEVLDKWK